MQKISIVGYGRFGKVLYKLLKDDFVITLYDKSKITKDSGLADSTTIAKDIREIYENDVIFYAVPIESFEKIISSHRKYFGKRHLLIDTLSVKMHPAKVLKKSLAGTGTQAMLTHPMFGPDSATNSFEGLPMIMDRFLSDETNYRFWKQVFEKKGLRVVEMTPYEHDKIAADSQGLTHFVGRLLEMYGFEPTLIDSSGAKKLLEVKALISHDTWQLFTNLQHYNPFTKKMRIKLGESYDALYNKILPRQANPDYITYGIQGGQGSFNEEALLHHIAEESIGEHKIKYLYTSENVLKELHEGEIDIGQMAIHNSIGGIVDESIQAMANYKFKIAKQFTIKISHALMIREDAKLEDITAIMSHPQVFAQCKDTLLRKYPRLVQTSGEGTLIDHALVAKKLGDKKLPKNIATMGSKILAKLYGLKVIEDGLQDAKENWTGFVLLARYKNF